MGPKGKTSLHYEAAFEAYLRFRGLPYVAVNEARRALLAGAKLKSFDFVVYNPSGPNMLVDIKGRICRPNKSNPQRGNLANWATRQDIDDLRAWEEVFGSGFQAIFVFMYQWQGEPSRSPFQDLFLFDGKWYATFAIDISTYRGGMKARSAAWGTVHLRAEDFRNWSKPFEEWIEGRV